MPSDNFLSNESGYQNVIPALLKTLKPGGVYIGAGPERPATFLEQPVADRNCTFEPS